VKKRKKQNKNKKTDMLKSIGKQSGEKSLIKYKKDIVGAPKI